MMLMVLVALLSLGAGVFIGRYATVHGILAISAYPIVCDDERRTHKVSDSASESVSGAGG